MTKSKEQRLEQLHQEMLALMVNTPTGKQSLYSLCHENIKAKTLYFNMVEKPVEKKNRTINNDFVVKKVVHDWGFIFNDGLEIRHVAKKYWVLFPGEIIEKRERIAKVERSV